MEALADAQTQRVLFKGKHGEDWTVWLGGATAYTMPVPADLFDGDDTLGDRTQNVELVLVNSLDFADGVDFDGIAAPGGPTLDLLLLTVERASFIDVRP